MNKENYLLNQIAHHVGFFFKEEARCLLEETKIVFTNYKEALSHRGDALVIPNDIQSGIDPVDIYNVPFNGTRITLWNKLPKPSTNDWVCLPSEEYPVWYQHRSGTVIPAWNIFGNLMDLLTFREEQEISTRDQHGRFIAEMSPRYKTGLLEIPAFNEAVALIIAACLGMKKIGKPDTLLYDLLESPILILSHDVDILLGNDFWTQAARLYHTVVPIMEAKPPHLKNLRWFVENLIDPRKYFFNDIAKIINLEIKYNSISSFYFLNGKGGRFGARSGSGLIPEAISLIPPEWCLGMHYNYNTLFSSEDFNNQLNELSKIIGEKPTCGRAHYLQFDPLRSFPFLSGKGIKCDETVGYPDCIGYRCGIAGIFQPYDKISEKPMPIYEVPLAVMDVTLLKQYPKNPVGVYERLVKHLERIGGAITVLYHPGMVNNPECPDSMGLYESLLNVSSRYCNNITSCMNILSLTKNKGDVQIL